VVTGALAFGVGRQTGVVAGLVARHTLQHQRMVGQNDTQSYVVMKFVSLEMNKS
jgi:hypothetical protein